MDEIGTKDGRLSTLYGRKQFVICKEKFLEVDNIPHTKIISLSETAWIIPIWVVRATTDGRVYKNIKH